MPSIYTISDFLRAFEGVYETIDVRAAVVRDKEQWLLVALSAHVRMASPETAKQEFLDTVKKFGTIDSPVFHIVQQCYLITEAQRFFQEIKTGNLKLENFQIWLSDSCDILTLAGSVRVDYHNPARWPRIEQQRQIVARDQSVRQLLLNNAEILRDTEMAGYENPHVAVKTFLGIDISQSTEPGGVWIACDVPVRLLPPEATRNGKEFRLKLRAEAHPAIEDVACTIRRTGGLYGSDALQQQSVIKLTRSAEAKNPTLWSGEIQLPIERDDQVTLEILSKKVGKLYHINNIRPFNLLPIEQTNPLLVALRLFCPPEEISQLLQEPHRANVDLANLKNPGRLFEVSVQWLLSVLGFRAVWLHNYEKLKDANMDYGTVDCLAYKEDEDLLLLVNCSLAAPDPSELNRHEDLMTRLTNRLFQGSKIKVRSALFTTAHKPETGQQNSRGSAIKVFYKEDIDQLLHLMESGQVLEYLRFASPFFS